MTTPQYQSYGSDSSRGDRTDLTALVTATPKVIFKVPDSPATAAARRKRKVKVLEEDEYSEKVEAIIERDFFPELEKLHAQADYIEAKEKNDYATMMRLQEKYSGCRPATGRLASPATFETPQDLPRENDPRRPGTSRPHSDTDPAENPDDEPISAPRSGEAAGNNLEVESQEKAKKLQSLDDFLANHTSEDNESFDDIQEEAFKKHRIKKAWMFKDEGLYLENKARVMALPSVEQQAALPWGGSDKGSGHDDKPLNVELWTYQNINSIFHYPDTLELTEDQKMEIAKKQKEIIHSNTRLEKNPWKSEKQMEALRREADRMREAQEGRVGIDGKELVRPETPSINGFKMMSMTPSPALGPGDSPLMTWGEVESTPYRLEGAETPLVISGDGGGGYSMKAPSQRDRLAKELADKNSQYYRDRKTKAIEQAKKSLKGARMVTNRPGSALAHMSPAAQRLASGKLGIRLGTDHMLRSSYTPSPARKSRGTPTPSRGDSGSTPTPRATPGKVTPSNGGRAARGITDNLLNIGKAHGQNRAKVNTDNLLNISGRSRAADFFGEKTKEK